MSFSSDELDILRKLGSKEKLDGDERRALLKLKTLTEKAKARSYSPYSRFRVGCALVLPSGKVYLGCNVENAAYGECICAERTAITKAVSEGELSFSFCAVSTDLPDTCCSPCGSCRQVIREFGKECLVYSFPAKADAYKVWTVEEMLPNSFGPEDLSKPRALA